MLGRLWAVFQPRADRHCKPRSARCRAPQSRFEKLAGRSCSSVSFRCLVSSVSSVLEPGCRRRRLRRSQPCTPNFADALPVRERKNPVTLRGISPQCPTGRLPSSLPDSEDTTPSSASIGTRKVVQHRPGGNPLRPADRGTSLTTWTARSLSVRFAGRCPQPESGPDPVPIQHRERRRGSWGRLPSSAQPLRVPTSNGIFIMEARQRRDR